VSHWLPILHGNCHAEHQWQISGPEGVEGFFWWWGEIQDGGEKASAEKTLRSAKNETVEEAIDLQESGSGEKTSGERRGGVMRFACAT